MEFGGGGGDNVVDFYHVTIVAISHGLLKKFWPMGKGCVLRILQGVYSKMLGVFRI